MHTLRSGDPGTVFYLEGSDIRDQPTGLSSTQIRLERTTDEDCRISVTVQAQAPLCLWYSFGSLHQPFAELLQSFDAFVIALLL